MPQTRLCAPHVVCAVGLLLLGWGGVRAVGPAHAELPVPTLTIARERDRPPPHTPQHAATTATTATATTAATTAPPVRLDLPTLGVHAPIVPVAVDGDGALAVPEDPDVVGWWAAGGGLADPGGALVLDGHVDTAAAGPGALFHLTDLATGDAVGLTASDGVAARFTVTAVRAYPKAELPADVFRPSPTPRLVIITCGGHFDRDTRQYVDNIVAYAEPG